MAYSEGQLNGAQDYRVGIDVWYSGVQDWGANSSRFDWNVRIVGTYGSWTNGTSSWSSSIGGVGYSGTFTLPQGWGSPRIVGSGQTWHGHDANGYRPGFASNAYMNVPHSNIGQGGSGDAWVDAPRIPKAPQAPSISSLSNISPTNIRVNGTIPDNMGAGIDAYGFQWGFDSNWGSAVGYTEHNGSVLDIGGLSERTTYYFRMRAHNSQGWSGWSNTVGGTTTGHPTAPQSVSATPSTSVTGRVQIAWSAPASTGQGGIVGYNIFRNGTQIATTTGTGTGYTDNGLTPYTSYTYTVAARNSYSTSVSGYGPQSSDVAAVAPGPPSAPRNLTAVANDLIPGRVDLSWTVPANTGAGGITGYQVYFAGGSQIVNQNGTGTTYSVTGLNPGTTYSFQVFARNALGDTEGTKSAGSNTPTVTPIGEPQAPTNVTVSAPAAFANRLTVSWTAPPGTLTGYNIFRRTGSVDTLIGTIPASFTSYSMDGLTTGASYTAVVRARTAYTDTLAEGYPGNWGGPASSAVTATATANQSQPVPSVAAVVSGTNALFAGTYTINAITSNTIGYARTGANVPSAATTGSVANNTNAIFNGTYTIAVPTLTTMTYSKTNANITQLNAAGLITDITNTAFNGTVVVTAVNVGANTVSYSNTGADLAARAVPVNPSPGQSGFITNLSNAIFNGTGKTITAATSTTISYAQTNADVAESNAAGIVTNTTNRDVFNGLYAIASIPAYNVVRYAKTASNIPLRTWSEPNGVISRYISPSTLDVRFRSGWSG